MNVTLKRNEFSSQGIFGELQVNGCQFASLEHAYGFNDKEAPSIDQVAMGRAFITGPNGSKAAFLPKIPPGTYPLIRGPHRLHGMDHDFETFMITGVAGHTNLLFHWGNYNKDSEGCVLVGLGRTGNMITQSREAFELFMKQFAGLNTATLTVI